MVFQHCGEDNRDTKVAKDSSHSAENLKALIWLGNYNRSGVANEGTCNPCRRVILLMVQKSWDGAKTL